MDKEMLRIYTARISQANRSELITIIYDIIIYDLESAEKAFDDKDMELFDRELKQAQRFMNELMGSLNYNYVISLDLMQLYLYVNKRIVTAIMKKDAEPIRSAVNVMKELLVGFDEVAKQDNSAPLLENAQKLYAGLTYGRGSLNETYMDPNEHNRGFKA